jgi:hypothetical protein
MTPAVANVIAKIARHGYARSLSCMPIAASLASFGGCSPANDASDALEVVIPLAELAAVLDNPIIGPIIRAIPQEATDVWK